ncbi:MAG: lignostilbene alpha-beta-dioxygenase [Pseudomonadales bacterium]|nr:lignostilbene alpha-beta-dioxygenase [Pseudomonadales bacterium]NIX07350.1 lignostilbene alpha-beta-dioxygenase [Pseudomonadales bacterium]
MSTVMKGANEPPTCHGGLKNLDEEHDYWIDDIEGAIPADLIGTFMRNGPGRQKIGGKPFGHWFDGDGMISQFTFTESKAHFRNRYVRTPKYVEETEAQKILYRGFGTQIPGGWTKNIFKWPANPANTSIIYHGGRLLALNEGGRPWELEPGSLETVGEFDYDGALAGKAFSAHGKVHPQTGDYFNFGAGTTGTIKKAPCLNLYRINPQGRMAKMSQLPLQTFPFCHDFALAGRHAVYFINSIVFAGMGGFFLGRHSMSDGVRFDDDIPMRIIVVDLDTLEVVREYETEPGAIIHFGNAFENGDELVVDAMFQDNFEVNATLADVFNPSGRFGGGYYNRYRLNLADGSMSCDRVSECEAEFPVFNPAKAGQPHSVTWTACSVENGANSFFNGFQRVTFDGEADVVTLPAGCYGSEPMFAPAEGATREDDGYLLDVVYDGYSHRSELQIYRADDVNDRVCTLHLSHHLPHQFHGYFSSRTFLA